MFYSVIYIAHVNTTSNTFLCNWKKPQNSLKIVSMPALDFKIMHVHIYCFFNSVT